MLLLSMKMYLALLWGVSALFSTESMSVSTPATSNISSTSTTKRLISEDVVHTETTAWHKTNKPAEVSSAAAETTDTPTAERDKVDVTYGSNSSNDMATTSVAMSTVATTASNSASQQTHTSAAASTPTDEAQPSPDTTISEIVKPTKDQLHQHTPSPLIDVTPSVTTSAAPSAADSVSSPQPSSTDEPEVASSLPSTTSPADTVSTTAFIQNHTPSASTSTMTVNPTSEAATVSDTTYSSSTKSETSTTSTELSSTPQPAFTTISSISTSEAVGASSTTEASTNLESSSSTAESSTASFTSDSANSTTEAVSSSTAGVFIHHVPKRLPIPTAKSTPPAPLETSKSPPHTDGQPCSNRALVRQSLIAIACLAALATIFMVTTVILCTKLSSRKYRVKKPQQATEMMCISALLPESDYSYTRRRAPVTNGILVMHHAGDSDEDGGDNLTLSSFLPENDRYV